MKLTKTILMAAVLSGAMFAPVAVRAEGAAAPATEKATERPGKFAEHGAKMFDETDSNKDGAVNLEEFLARPTEKFTERFKEIDKDGNGSLSKEEFAAHGEGMREKMKGHREKMKEKAGEKAPAKPAE